MVSERISSDWEKNGIGNQSQLEQVLWYREQGWWVIDTALRSKIPNASPEGWQNQRLEKEELEQRFSALQNVSLLLGVDPVILIDVDLDTPEAARAAIRRMPKTGALFGRKGRGLSHYLYQVPIIPKTMAWKIGNRKIIELRSKGHQTIIPNSVHPTGADVLWVNPHTRKIQFDFTARPEPPGMVNIEELIERLNYIAAVAAVAEIWSQGGRHDLALCLAGGLSRSGYDRELAIQFIQDICEVAADEDEATNQMRSLAVNSTYDKWDNGDRKLRGWPSVEEMTPGNGKALVYAIKSWLGIDSLSHGDDLLPPFSDKGNAIRFVNTFARELRFNTDTGEWLAWEGTRWKAGRSHTATHLAKEISTQIQREAVEQLDPKIQADMWKFGLDSGNEHRIRHMVTLAQSEPELIVYAPDLDSDPADINLINYTFNLETMSHRPHRAEDLISKLCPVKYDPLAKPDERWLTFIHEVTRGDDQFARYLQIAAGLTLSGFTDQEVVFITHGPAGTGKTTFLEAIRAVMGDYAAAASPEAFLAGKSVSSGSARPDLIRLMGKRFVTAVEIDEGRHLAHSVVKMMTGGDTVSARQLYREEIEFLPVCKIWIATNHDPGIRANDSGMWRRVHVLNFHNVVPEERQDKTLKSYLRDTAVSGSALLNWMIEGYRMYRQIGLTKPDVVKNAIAEYRETQDFMYDFYAANCIDDKNATTMGNDLMERYKTWARQTGNPDLATNVLAARFREHGWTNERTTKGKRWCGVRLRSLSEVHGIGPIDLTEREFQVASN